MAFIDEIKVNIKAGNGGGGVVRWRHEKGKDLGGPCGGNGGRGGDVYAKALRDPGILGRYRKIKEFAAENGEVGLSLSKHGKDGEDLYIELPVGSVITNISNGKKYFLNKDSETVFLLKGGNGGIGNEYFKSSVNRRPKQFTEGKPGEMGDFLIELELVADLGLAGFPNAGKSSLLNALTNAEAKVASYEFTTLEPNLGDMYGYIIADIPGLIEGASEGKGLGHKFLRHIKRTKCIMHLISLENSDLEKSYEVIRNELSKFSSELADKPEIVVLTKTDTVSAGELEKKIKLMKKKCDKVFSVSIIDEESVKQLKDNLIKYLRSVEEK